MRVAILTTQTSHHIHFVRTVAARFEVGRVFVETTAATAPFETAHPFEQLRDAREWEAWFGGTPARLADYAESETFADLNDPAAVGAVAALEADVAIVFGTRRLRAPALAALPTDSFNLHGGDPERYRGLDTHLWAIYHRDFEGLVTCLHRLDAELDSGAIVACGKLALKPRMPLADLRRVNTETCNALTLDALETLDRGEHLPGRPQRQRGRYYSFMPTVLKDICLRQFDAHVAKLSAAGGAA